MKKILTIILSIKGYSNSTFRPNDNVSRAEFVAMTVRLILCLMRLKKAATP